MRYIMEYDKKRRAYRVNPQDLAYVVDKGNRNQMDNYGVYLSDKKALRLARRVAMDRHTSEIKRADGKVWAILTEV